MKSGRPYVTMILVGLNVAVFLAMLASGISPVAPDTDELLAVGASRGILLVFHHEWWRAFTSNFVNVGVMALAINAYSLWSLGGVIEEMLPRRMYVLIYLLCGLGSALASALWNPTVVSGGSAGATFGLFGFLIGFGVQARAFLAPDAVRGLWGGILVTVALNAALAFFVPTLDVAAPLGGLLVGMLSGFVATASAIEREEPIGSMGSQVIVVVAVIGLGVLAAVRTQNNPVARAANALDAARAALGRSDLPQVERFTNEVLEAKQDSVAYYWRGIARHERGDVDGSLDDLNASIAMAVGTEQNELLSQAYALRARIHHEALRFAECDADLTRAHLVRPNTALLAIRSISRLRLGDVDGGLQDARTTLADPKARPLSLNNVAWGLLATGQDLDLALQLVDESIKREPRASAQGTRCFIRVARNEPQLGLSDCVAAVAGANDLMDRGMVAFIQNRPEEAISLWEEAAKRTPLDAKDLAPWLAKARAQLPVEDDAGVP